MASGKINLGGGSSGTLTPAIGYTGSEVIRVLQATTSSGSKGRRRRRAASVELAVMVDITTISPTMTTSAVDSVLSNLNFVNIFVKPSANAAPGSCRDNLNMTLILTLSLTWILTLTLTL
jgi:hypothetical protein